MPDWLNNEVVLDVGFLTLILASVIPFLTGVVTKLEASSGVKAAVTAVLAVGTGVVQALVDSGGRGVLSTLIINAVAAFVVANTAYQSLYKPTGAAAAVATRVAPDSGIGTPVEEPWVYVLPDFLLEAADKTNEYLAGNANDSVGVNVPDNQNSNTP